MNINIARPCHENWEAMTNSDTGRFCASCQKTVVDFTNMSDREIIEYFSKETGSVCGRLTDEQLSKDLVIPPKPVPWVKYFFRIMFPAFIMSLKSCIPNSDSKQNTTKSYSVIKGQIKRNTTLTGDTTFATETSKRCYVTKGVVSPQLDPGIDSNDKNKTGKPIIKKNFANKLKMNIEPIPLIHSPQIQPVIPEKMNGYSTSDNVVVSCKSIRVGGAFGTPIKLTSKPTSLIKKVIDTVKVFSSSPKILLFPNPVASNSRLNIKLGNVRHGDYLLSLMNLSGIILQNQELKVDAESNVISMDLKTISAGTYLVRMVDRSDGKSIAQKLLVL